MYKQLIVSGTVTAQRHYVENLEVTATSSVTTDGHIDFALMDEGRIVHTDSGYRYEYWLTDHLGNNRVAFRTRSNGSVQLSQVQNYYPFGSEMGDSTMNYSICPHNHYRYSDKEFQHELDLDTYDFGARHYDAVLGRWMGIDPLAWLADSQSPFNYTENNPMNMVDLDGMQANPHGSFLGVPLGGLTSGSSWGNPWDIGGAGLSAGTSIINAWNAFSWKTPSIQNWSKNLSGVQGNGAVRSSIPQPHFAQHFEPYTGPNPEERNAINQLTNKLVNDYRKTHSKFIPDDGAVNELNPIRGVLEVGMATIPVVGPEIDAEILSTEEIGEGGLNLFKTNTEQAVSETGWKKGDNFLRLQNKGSVKLNWKQNASYLRNEMRSGKPIFDSFKETSGKYIPTNGFLNAERNLLKNAGWKYNPARGAWLPPIN